MRQIRGTAAAGLGVLFLLIEGGPTQAQCSFGCNRYESGRCVEYRTCSPGVPGSSAPAYSFGAIAYGPTSRAWGYSYHWGSRGKAESVAMQNCAKHGNDCEVMVWFDRRCGAVSAGEGTAAYWGIGRDDAQARAAAQKKCADDGGKGCAVQVSQCSR